MTKCSIFVIFVKSNFLIVKPEPEIHIMKILLPIIFVFIFITNSYSQEVVDVIHLRNGSVIKGTIIERVKNVSVTIETLGGNTYLVKKIAIKKITRETLEIPFDKDSRIFFFMSIGYTVPAAEPDFRKTNISGYNFNFAGAYEFNRDLALRIDFQYNNFPSEIGGSSFSLLALKSDLLIYSLKELAINPYAYIGGGGYLVNVTKEFKPRLGACFGVGINFRLSENRLYLYAETQVNYIFQGGPEKVFMPGRIGIMMTNKLFSREN